MPSLQRLKERLIFWKDWYPTNAVVFRRRGDHAVPEFTSAVRIHYDDRPNIHKLKTGEETKAVDLEGVAQAADGTSTIFLYEAEDGQLLPWKPTFDEDDVQTQLIENLDERLNFHVTHLEKKEEKYSIPGWINENKDLVMTIGTALAVAIIIYAAGSNFGDAVPYMKQISEHLPGLTEAIQQSTPSPPGN